MTADVAGEGTGAEQSGGAPQAVGGDEIGVPGDGLVRALHDGDPTVGSGQRGFVGSGHTGYDAPFALEVDDGRRGVPAVEDVGGLISAGSGEEHLHAGVSRGRQQPGSGLVGPGWPSMAMSCSTLWTPRSASRRFWAVTASISAASSRKAWR